MGQNTVVKVAVEKLTKFGYADAEGYVSYSKNCTDHDKALVVPGAQFEAEIYTAPSGARYLNKIVARSPHVEAPKAIVTDVNPPVDKERAKKFVPKFEKKSDDEKMTKADWSAKDRSQLIGGLSHDAATLAVVVLNLDGSNQPGTESALRVYKTLLEGMLQIREEIK